MSICHSLFKSFLSVLGKELFQVGNQQNSWNPAKRRQIAWLCCRVISVSMSFQITRQVMNSIVWILLDSACASDGAQLHSWQLFLSIHHVIFSVFNITHVVFWINESMLMFTSHFQYFFKYILFKFYLGPLASHTLHPPQQCPLPALMQ